MSQNTSLPVPLIIPNSGRWLGNYGNWSTFAIQIGTPPQRFSVLPNFNGQMIFVPNVADCLTIEGWSPNDCVVMRGAENPTNQPLSSLQVNVSSTWSSIGRYDLNIAPNFDLFGTAMFGFDNFKLGSAASRNEVLLQRAVIAAYTNANYFWMGQLGLAKTPPKFNSLDSPSPSFISRMKEDGKIPSLSFAYQAGAAHRFNRVSASLVLGGYDESLVGKDILQSSNSSFYVGLQTIFAGFDSETMVPLLTEGIMTIIETNFPDLWLPPSVCESFAKFLNLTYSDKDNRYFLTDDVRSKLQQGSPSFVFRLATSTTSKNTINITIPYAAFDLQAWHPIVVEKTNYFPLRKAKNESQYALGRAFLQEAYFSADLERGTFNLSQAVLYDPPLLPAIVAIDPLDRTKPKPPITTGGHVATSTNLSPGVIAGIAISIIALIGFLAAITWGFYRRRRNVDEGLAESSMPGKSELPTYTIEELSSETLKTKLELDGTPIEEMYALHGTAEIEAPKGVELATPHVIGEVESPHGRSEM